MPELYRICERGLEGFIDGEGTVVIEPQFSSVEEFSNGLALVQLPDQPEERFHAFIKQNGEIQIQPGPPKGYQVEPDECCWQFRSFSEELARFWINDAYGRGGYMNRDGECVIDPIYTAAEPFGEGLAFVQIGDHDAESNRHFFIDRFGERTAEIQGRLIGASLKEGRCLIVQTDDEGETTSGFISKDAEWIVDPVYASASDFREGRAVVSKLDDKNEYLRGFIDPDGAEVIPCRYESVSDFSNGLAWVQFNGKHFLIDPIGNIVRDLQLRRNDSVDPFSEGLATVWAQDEKDPDEFLCGAINKNGEWEIPKEFSWLGPFRGGLAAARKGKQTGYINPTGNFVWGTKKWDGYVCDFL